jgi:hypothetical protein
LDPAWPRRMTPVSSAYFGCEDVTDACVQAGPLMPRALQLQFTRLGEGKGVEMEKDGFGLLGRSEC